MGWRVGGWERIGHCFRPPRGDGGGGRSGDVHRVGVVQYHSVSGSGI